MKTLNEYVMQASNFHPIKLDEYLSTKIDNKSLVVFDFPDTPKFEDYMEFFKKYEFEQIKWGYNKSIFNEFKDKSSLNRPLFMLEEEIEDVKTKLSDNRYSSWIRFCNKGEINKENRICCVNVTGDGHEIDKYRYYVGIVAFDDNMIHNQYFKDYSEFKEEAKNYFMK